MLDVQYNCWHGLSHKKIAEVQPASHMNSECANSDLAAENRRLHVVFSQRQRWDLSTHTWIMCPWFYYGSNSQSLKCRFATGQPLKILSPAIDPFRSLGYSSYWPRSNK